MSKELEFIKKIGKEKEYEKFINPTYKFEEVIHPLGIKYDFLLKFEQDDYYDYYEYLGLMRKYSQIEKIRKVNDFIYYCAEVVGIIATNEQMLDEDFETYTVENNGDGSFNTYYWETPRSKNAYGAFYNDENKLQTILNALSKNKNFIEVMKPKEVK